MLWSHDGPLAVIGRTMNPDDMAAALATIFTMLSNPSVLSTILGGESSSRAAIKRDILHDGDVCHDEEDDRRSHPGSWVCPSKTLTLVGFFVNIT